MKAIGVDSGKGATNAVRPLDPSERRTFNTANTPQRTRGNPNVTIIAESGLYKLVMRSDKSNAKPFQDWVTKVVLPAIRKHGAYIMGRHRMKPTHPARQLTSVAQRHLLRLPRS